MDASQGSQFQTVVLMFKPRHSLIRGLGLVRIAILALLSLLLFPFLLAGQNVHGQSLAFSSIYIQPVQIGGPGYKPSSTFWVNVMANVTASDTINTYDVILNYSNYPTIVPTERINFTGNIFQGKSSSIVTECVDSIVIVNECTGISQGATHILEAISGDTVSGVQGGLLFSAEFQVQRNGTSLLSLGRADLINPYGTGNPSIIDTVYVHLVSTEGIFANRGLVAFFNYLPSYSPAILPGEQILFDARGSFNASSSGIGIAGYSWNFSDMSPLGAGVATSHAFSSTGTHNVTLTVTSSMGGHVMTTSRSVMVVPALGQLVLRLAESRDRRLPSNIQVQIFNSTTFALPFQTGASNTSNIVVFQNLQPGNYFFKFSASGIQDHSDSATVYAGLTTTHTVYLELTPAPPPPPPSYGYLFYLVPLLGGLGVASVLIVRKARLISRRRQ